MTFGTLLKLEYQGQPDDLKRGVCTGQRLQLAFCDDNSLMSQNCSVFCRDGEKCARLLNGDVANGEHHVALGSNQICTREFSHLNGQTVDVCLPNALLREDAIRRGRPCTPPICEWRKTARCANSNEALPPRINDGTLEYESCCATTDEMNKPNLSPTHVSRAFESQYASSKAAPSAGTSSRGQTDLPDT